MCGLVLAGSFQDRLATLASQLSSLAVVAVAELGLLSAAAVALLSPHVVALGALGHIAFVQLAASAADVRVVPFPLAVVAVAVRLHVAFLVSLACDRSIERAISTQGFAVFPVADLRLAIAQLGDRCQTLQA